MEKGILDRIWSKKIDHLYHDKIRYEMGIARIREYVESVEQLLSERKSKLEQNPPEFHPAMSEEEYHAAWESHALGIYEIEYDIANIQRYSLFAYSYSFFESQFKRIAESYASMHKLKPSYSCYERGKGIKRTRKYFKNIASIDWSEYWPKWEDINDLLIIRNLIVHNDGKFHTDPTLVSAQSCSFPVS